MGQYKVPQNVEAEDKILGPLTLKQFIYAVVGVSWAGLSFLIFRKLPAVMVIVGLPPTVLFLLLAFYQRDGQNFEQLLIAMVGFFTQSRRRLWVKEEVANAFRIEPKPVAVAADQRNPAEVRSELEKLGSVIDSRGWNRPPEDVEMLQAMVPTSDRLVQPEPAATTPAPDQPGPDMLDLKGSPLATNLGDLLNEAAGDVRTEALEMMKDPPKTKPSVSVTAPAANDILKLATERDDLTVSEVAAAATRMAPLAEGQSVDLRNGK